MIIRVNNDLLIRIKDPHVNATEILENFLRTGFIDFTLEQKGIMELDTCFTIHNPFVKEGYLNSYRNVEITRFDVPMFDEYDYCAGCAMAYHRNNLPDGWLV